MLQVGFYYFFFFLFPSSPCSSQRLHWGLYCGTIGAGPGEKPPRSPLPPSPTPWLAPQASPLTCFPAETEQCSVVSKAPVSNEFSTAVLSCRESEGGGGREALIYSALQSTLGSVTVGLFATAHGPSGGPFSFSSSSSFRYFSSLFFFFWPC